MSKFSVITVSAFIVLILGLVLWRSASDEPKLGTQYESQGQAHLRRETGQYQAYNSNLPTSGPHAAQPAEWGVYAAEVPDERLVHNMEHGGIVITYKPDLAADTVAKLKTIAETVSMTDDGKSKTGFKVVLAPRSENTAPIQLAAWQYNLSMDALDTADITQFYRDHLNSAPESRAA